MNAEDGYSWDKAVRTLQMRVNAVRLLEAMSVPVFYIGTIAAFAVYYMRRIDVSPAYAAIGAVVLLMVCLAWQWRKVRSVLFRKSDASAFLDEQMGLHGSLSAALELGHARIPAPTSKVRQSYKWSSFGALYWLLGGVAMVLAGVLLPVSSSANPLLPPAFSSVPPALSQVDEWVNQMEQMESIEEESIQPIKEQLDEFFKKDTEELYTHSGLEAADALKAQTEATMMEFAKGLDNVNSALGDAQAQLARGMEPNMAGLQEALSAMEKNQLQPGGNLAQGLSSLDANSLRQLDPEQIKQLMQQMKEMSTCVNGMCQGKEGGIVDPDSRQEEEGLAGMPNGGDPSRGRGDAPLSFKDEASGEIDSGKEKLSAQDLSRTALGEQVDVQKGEHQVTDAEGYKVQSTGPAANPAQGGDAVWTDNVSPREREALRQIFK